MSARVYPVNWRNIFNALQPYLTGGGGVVRVHCSGAECAPSAFLATLTSEYEWKETESSGVSLRIDRTVYSTRYLVDVREEFIRKMQLELPEAATTSIGGAPLTVGSEIAAQGSVEQNISDIEQNIYISGDNPALMARGRSVWTDALRQQLCEFLVHGRMMIIINHGPSADQDEFWRYLWDGCLDSLLADGLFLVHMVEAPNSQYDIHDLAPSPDMELRLPTAYSDAERTHAIGDLSEIIQRRSPSMTGDEVRAAAQALIDVHFDDIPRLHSRLSGYLTRLAQGSL